MNDENRAIDIWDFVDILQIKNTNMWRVGQIKEEMKVILSSYLVDVEPVGFLNGIHYP